VTHLDTTFLVDVLREARSGGHGPAHVLLEELAEEELAVSVHVACEIHAGAALSDDPALERERVAALLGVLSVVQTDDRFAPRYGALLAELTRRGEIVATMDLLIATTALIHGAPVVTRNVRDFEKVPELVVRAY
jgi:tRNA(fMet)-specific endonuclease VapC